MMAIIVLQIEVTESSSPESVRFCGMAVNNSNERAVEERHMESRRLRHCHSDCGSILLLLLLVISKVEDKLIQVFSFQITVMIDDYDNTEDDHE